MRTLYEHLNKIDFIDNLTMINWTHAHMYARVCWVCMQIHIFCLITVKYPIGCVLGDSTQTVCHLILEILFVDLVLRFFARKIIDIHSQ